MYIKYLTRSELIQIMQLQSRFKSPVPVDRWEGIRQATKFGKPCLQYIYDKLMGDENCLYLNVYSPRMKFGSQLVTIL